MELGYIPLVLFHDIIKKGMVNLLKKQLTANEIRYRTYDCITTMCRPSYIPAMHRIHGGTPATAVRSGSRPAPPDSRYLADQKGSGRPLRWPQMGRFLRAEGYSRRCRHSEAVAAQRHLSPRRPSACNLRPAACAPRPATCGTPFGRPLQNFPFGCKCNRNVSFFLLYFRCTR